MERERNNLSVTVVAFGYKYGIPLDADLVFDVRFLPNPYYVDELRALTGNNGEVREYIIKWPETQEFLKRLFEFHDFMLPLYSKMGKTHLTICIGCTGGRHRSITLGNELAHYLQKRAYHVTLEHRDLQRSSM